MFRKRANIANNVNTKTLKPSVLCHVRSFRASADARLFNARSHAPGPVSSPLLSTTMSLDFVERLSQQHSVLLDLLRGYAALSPVRFLEFPSHMAFDIVHNFLMDDILLNPQFTMYSPSIQYQTVFWKWALYNLEMMADSEVFFSCSPWRIHADRNL